MLIAEKRIFVPSVLCSEMSSFGVTRELVVWSVNRRVATARVGQAPLRRASRASYPFSDAGKALVRVGGIARGIAQSKNN